MRAGKLCAETMDRTLVEYFCCPDYPTQFEMGGKLSAATGFFAFGRGAVCYGQCGSGVPSEHFAHDLLDVSHDVKVEGERLSLPFDFSTIIDNLRRERYY